MKLNPEIFDHKFYRNLSLILIGIGFYFIILNFNLISSKIAWIFSLFQPFVLGFVFAFLLNGLLDFFERKVFQKTQKFSRKRSLSLLCTFLLTLGIIVLIFSFLVPQLSKSLGLLLSKIPEYLNNLQTFLLNLWPSLDPESLTFNDQISAFFSEQTPKIFTYSGKIFSSIFNIVIGIIIAVYFLYNRENYLNQLKKIFTFILSPRRANQLKRFALFGSQTFTNFFYGKLLDSLIVGVICFIGLLILQIPYALLISVVIAVTNIIPFFGPFIGAIPTVILILAIDPTKGLWLAIFLLVLQQFDGNLLGPKILGNSTGLPSIWVMFAILIGGGLFGFTGLVLGIPVMAIIYKLVQDQLNQRQVT